MTLFSRTAIMAAALVVGLAGGPAVGHAEEAAGPAAPAPQAPAAQPSLDLELESGGTTPFDALEADPFGRAPGCPLRDDETPRLLIG